MPAKTTKTTPRKTTPKVQDPKALMKKLNLHQTYALDIDAIRDGVWTELRNGIKVRVRPYMNKEFAMYLDKLRAPHKNDIRQGKKLDETLAVKYAVQALCKEILVDWSGVTIEEGGVTKEVPYDADFAFSILSQPEYAELADEVIRLSQKQEQFRASYSEESEKN